jgi:hypothetical protein
MAKENVIEATVPIYAWLDGMSKDNAKRTLKEEARLRKQAQTEAAELRA